MKDRIRQIMDSQHMNQQTFAQFIGMSSASLSSIFNGRTNPTLNTVEAIRSKFPNINIEWLMFGTGSMYIDNDSATDKNVNPINSGGTESMLDFDTPTPPKENISSNNQKELNRNSNCMDIPIVKYVDKPNRQIVEIRVFYDDQTWESFVIKK
jgi:transcriptional regulator with XRE-family HTH domain